MSATMRRLEDISLLRPHVDNTPPLLRFPVLEIGLDTLPATASPLLHKLLQFWSAAAGADHVPSRERLDMFALRPWLGHISIYEAIDGGRDFRIRLEGTSIVAITGEDWTGKRATEVDARYGSQIAEFMRKVVRTHQPMVHTMRVFQNDVERITRLLLPVRARAGGPVNQVFLVIYADPQQFSA
jgi:hypothetical protein